uniref:Lipoprotein n=1 Tax=Acidobacterium capsulatum TaxID=33075 RepID=A0A7V5CSX7_9BACT
MHLHRRLPVALVLALSSIPLLFSGCGVTPGPGLASNNSAPPSGPPPVAVQMGTISITPQYSALGPGQQITLQATSTGGGALQWSVNGTPGGNAQVGTVDASGHYTAPAFIKQSENVAITAALASAPTQDYATAVISIIQPGVVAKTANPQVAQYSIYLPAPGKVSVEFGPSTGYGLSTWTQPTPTGNGGPVTMEVAGMLGNSNYHMRADVTLDDGATFQDTDHTFTTGNPPQTSPVQAQIMSGQYPQPGIEMWNTILPQNDAQLFATDLAGHVLWTYTYSGASVDLVQGFQPLSNGHFLILISYLSSLKSSLGFLQNNVINAVREIDLAGNTIREITMDQLNQELAAKGYNLTLKSFHHSAIELPNGHLVVLATYQEVPPNLSGYPASTTVTGDVLVDLDQNMQPDWVWNSFDHLDVNRHPMNFPDWTHSNDILYSPSDHDLLLSMRHQNWIIKIDFQDGQGTGNILWRLGYQGDFQLMQNGQPDNNPADWFYAQHGMSFFGSSTSGIFNLGLMDNGNDRYFSSGQQVQCGQPKPGAAFNPQCYSTMPVLQINEQARTATLLDNYNPGDQDFSFFGGNAEQLGNGDYQVDFCAPSGGAIVQELTPQNQVVWQGNTPAAGKQPAADQFHVDRLGSLYPGVTWTQTSF